LKVSRTEITIASILLVASFISIVVPYGFFLQNSAGMTVGKSAGVSSCHVPPLGTVIMVHANETITMIFPNGTSTILTKNPGGPINPYLSAPCT